MKRFILLSALLVLIVTSITSCSSTRDCRGGKHTRLTNGIII